MRTYPARPPTPRPPLPSARTRARTQPFRHDRQVCTVDGVHTESYMEIRSLAWSIVLINPTCMPLFFLFTLLTVRRTIASGRSTQASASIHLLHEAYRPQFFYWEVIRQ